MGEKRSETEEMVEGSELKHDAQEKKSTGWITPEASRRSRLKVQKVPKKIFAP